MERLGQQLNIPDIEKRVAKMKEIAAEREATEVIQLPLWPEPKRGTPNSFLRSALFAAIQSKDRVYLENATLFSQQDITVKFTGKQLNQEDLTLWETLVHLARQHPLGSVCEFTAHSILKAMGLSTGGEQHERLHHSIIRLGACLVEITYNRKTYMGSLVEGGIKDEDTKHYKIELNRKLIRLYGETEWTAVDWQQRLQLRNKLLAQALHAYYSSHQKPHPIKLETLHDLTGSKNKSLRAFKQKVVTALKQLVKIGFLQSYKIEGNLVSVERVYRALPKTR